MTAPLLALALALPATAGASALAPRAVWEGLGGAVPGEKDKPRKTKNQPFALLYGTVFDQDGRLVRNAQIEVRPREGKGRWEARSDAQGEFAVRLPAGRAVYTVEARAPGLDPGRKEVEFSSDERLDVVLQLKRP